MYSPVELYGLTASPPGDVGAVHHVLRPDTLRFGTLVQPLPVNGHGSIAN
jgi:hypothetical protein